MGLAEIKVKGVIGICRVRIKSVSKLKAEVIDTAAEYMRVCGPKIRNKDSCILYLVHPATV